MNDSKRSTRSIRFDVFGRQVQVQRVADGWQAYYPGTEGKRRPAEDIVIPAETAEPALAQYLADLCHEWASARYPEVRRLD